MLTVECKTLRKGFLAVDIAMVVLAVILFAPSSWIKGVQSSNVQKCNSFTGQLFQTLSREDSAICHIAPALLVMSQTGPSGLDSARLLRSCTGGYRRYKRKAKTNQG